MHISELVDNIYVITLKDRPDKLEHFEKEADKIGIEYDTFVAEKFTLATTGNLVDENYLPAYGCFDSHYNIYKHALHKGYETIAVFEDDATFTERYENFSEQVFDELQEILKVFRWDLFHFWCHPKYAYPITNYLKMIDGTGRSHANIVRKSAMEYFCANAHKIVDTPIDDLFRLSKLNKIAPVKNMVIAMEGYSDIEKLFTYCPLD